MNNEQIFSLRRLLSTEGHTFCDAGPSHGQAKAPVPDLGRGELRARELPLEAVGCSSCDHVTQGPGDTTPSCLLDRGKCTALTQPEPCRLRAARQRHLLVQRGRTHCTAGRVAAISAAKLPQPRDLCADGASTCCRTFLQAPVTLAYRLS